MKVVRLTCNTCNEKFDRPAFAHRGAIKSGQKHNYCSRQCQPRKKAQLRTCLTCEVETSNAKYCSKICAGKKLNNLGAHKQGCCKICRAIIPSQRQYCKPCYKDQGFTTDYNERSLIECRKRGSNSYHAMVRVHAKKVATEAGLMTSCKICDYTTIVECCHIKSVSSFPNTTKLSVVNSEDNLVGLCPNHHAEFDKGLITL